MVKYLYIKIICFLAVTLSIFPQLSYSSPNSDFKLGENRNKQYAITYKVFEKEFIFTNTASDYYRSYQRLISNYNIAIPEQKLSEILIYLTKSEKAFVNEAIASLVFEADEFSYYRNNKYYQTLSELSSSITKLNIVSAIEIALVGEYNKVAAVPTPYSISQSSKIRYLHLLNRARYELVSAALHHISKID
jgi:hypothetical protein